MRKQGEIGIIHIFGVRRAAYKSLRFPDKNELFDKALKVKYRKYKATEQLLSMQPSLINIFEI